MHFHLTAAAFILEVSHTAETVHKETYAGTSRSNHFGQAFLRRVRYGGFCSAFQLGELQESAGQPLFTAIEEVVNQICLHQHTAG